MRCDELDPLIEAFADGSREPAGAERAHLESCVACAAALERARAIEAWLVTRETPAPPSTFTAAVMARLGEESWRAERVVDFGFNLAVAAGLLVILMGAAGLAWSLGLLTVTIDVESVWRLVDAGVAERALSQAQTVAVASILLVAALALWWWAEADPTA